MLPAMAANADPAIYHITHIENLRSIAKSGCLWSDAKRIQQGFAVRNIGHSHIKGRRLTRDVPVAAGGHLGEYVPFNFCPRSVMLYAVSRGHQDYQGGADQIVHLVSSVKTAISTGRPWAFTDRHAEVQHALYYNSLAKLSVLDWNSIGATYWAGPDNQEVKEQKQAEFLAHDHFPWTGIVSVGVKSGLLKAQVETILRVGSHLPPVQVQQTWYY
jgi:hypothetical protein